MAGKVVRYQMIDIPGPTQVVQAFCPMGCGTTLHVRNGILMCEAPRCPNPVAAITVLHDPECEHIVTLAGAQFTIRHPLRERVGDKLMTCGLHTWLSDGGDGNRPAGRYRVLTTTNGEPYQWDAAE